MRSTLLLLIIIFTISCENNKVEYFDNGNKKITYKLNDGLKEGEEIEYYSNGNIKRISNYNQGEKACNEMIYDSIARIKYISSCSNNDTLYTIKYLYINSDTIITYGESKIENGKVEIKNGIYTTYLNDTLIKEEEYLNIRNDSYLNRLIIYDERNELDNSKSRNYTYKDSLWQKGNKEYIYKQMIFYLPDSLKFYGSNIYFGFDINEDFSNMDSIFLTREFDENKYTNIDGFGVIIEKDVDTPRSFKGVYEYYLDDLHEKKQSIYFSFYYP